MFVVWVGSALTTVFAIGEPGVFTVGVAVWLWFTVLFANLAEAVAEGRGKAQAETLRRTKKGDRGAPRHRERRRGAGARG
jgi:K+-transporting ATPase ATPase B chain